MAISASIQRKILATVPKAIMKFKLSVAEGKSPGVVICFEGTKCTLIHNFRAKADDELSKYDRRTGEPIDSLLFPSQVSLSMVEVFSGRKASPQVNCRVYIAVV
jgi:hypothetical protein